MARSTFGGTASDFVFTATSGRLLRLSAANLTMWTAESGGAQIVDLLLNGSPATVIPVGEDGQVPAFQGPDGVTELWADAGGGRIRIVAEGKQGPAGPVGPGSDITGAEIEAARDVTLAARDEVLAVPTTTDGLIASQIQTPGSQTEVALSETIVAETATPMALSTAGQIAVSEVSRVVRSSDDERAALTPDGRVAVNLLTGGAEQTYILTGCTEADDTTRFKYGTQSKRFTTAGETSCNVVVDPLFVAPAPDPHVFGAASRVNEWLWVDDPTKITTANLEIYPVTPGTGTTWIRGIDNQPRPLKYGWNLLTWAGDAAGDHATWGQAYRVRVVVVTTAATSFNIGRVWVETSPKARLILINDGCFLNFYNKVLADLRPRGIPVTWAAAPSLLGAQVGTKTERMTKAQLDTAYAAGDDVSFHSWGSEVHSTMTEAQVRENALKCLRWAQDNGYTRGRIWRAAITQNNAPNYKALAPYFAANSSWHGGASTSVFPPIDRQDVPRVTLHGTSPAAMDAFFAALKATHGVLFGYTHGIHVDGGSDMTPTEWAYFLSKIDVGIAEGWLEGVTMSQLIERGGGVLRA